jgi:hypothetical protein
MTMRQQVYHFRQSVDYHFEGKVALIAVNLKGVFLGMEYEIPAMLASGGGAIVNLSSTVGLVGTGAGIAPYIASKHGPGMAHLHERSQLPFSHTSLLLLYRSLLPPGTCMLLYPGLRSALLPERGLLFAASRAGT